MCGIVGEVLLGKGRVDLGRVRRRNATISHRGPDGAGEYIDPQGRCALAMRRLAIVDLAGGTQPMANEDETVWVVFNGEIYNHVALRRELEGLGHRFASDHSDTEVIVHGFEAWGPSLVTRLRGMFALAVWDEGSARLLLARDRLGKKPLYYARYRQHLIFGSELRTLLEDERLSPEVDAQALDRYLTYQFVPAPLSLVAGVRRLPAGHSLTTGSGEIKIERFWAPPDRMDLAVDLEQAVEELDRRLKESVGLRMRADVPVGVLLSGGLDSSLVTALAQRETGQPMHTFSVGFREAEYDESAVAARVSAEIGTRHHPLLVDEVDRQMFERLIDCLDEPLGDPAALPTFLVSELASRSVKVVLTGEGGDELFAGYEVYRRENELAWLLGTPRGLRRLVSAGLVTIEKAFPRVQRVGTIMSSDRAGWHTAFMTRIHERMRFSLYGSVFRRRVESAAAAGQKQHLTEGDFDHADWNAIASAVRQDVGSRLPDGLLMKVDKMTMAHSLEARTPFLDHELVEWALRLPMKLKVDSVGGKILVKRVAERYLSPSVVQRRKHPFDVPIGRWLRGSLRSALQDALEKLVGCGFSREGLLQITTRLDQGNTRVEYAAWLLLVLGSWLDRHPKILPGVHSYQSACA